MNSDLAQKFTSIFISFYLLTFCYKGSKQPVKQDSSVWKILPVNELTLFCKVAWSSSLS